MDEEIIARQQPLDFGLTRHGGPFDLYCSEVVGHGHCDFLGIDGAAALVDLQSLALAVQHHLQLLRTSRHKRRHSQAVARQPRVERLLQLRQHLAVAAHDLHPCLAGFRRPEERANAIYQHSAHPIYREIISHCNHGENYRPKSCSLVFHSFYTSLRSLANSFLEPRRVSLSQYSPLRSLSNSKRVRKSEVVAPLAESTQRQQQSTLKHPKKEQHSTLEAKSESTIPGCRQAVFTCGYLVSLSARPTVNSTLASLDLEQVESAPKSLPGMSSLGSAEVCLCASEERLMILPCLARRRRGSRRWVSRKWPKWFTAMVISTFISLTSRLFIIMPALLISTSITSKQPLTSCANRQTDCLLERSSLNHLMLPFELGEDRWIYWVACTLRCQFLLPMMML